MVSAVDDGRPVASGGLAGEAVVGLFRPHPVLAAFASPEDRCLSPFLTAREESKGLALAEERPGPLGVNALGTLAVVLGSGINTRAGT